MPEGWAWCRLKDICKVFGRIGFRGYTRDDLVEKGNGAITLSPSNLINMKLDLTNCTYISWSKYEESPEIQLDINDIVVVKTGSSYGKTALVDKLTEKTTLNPQLMVLKELNCNSNFLCYFLNTQYMRKHFEDLVNGTAIPTFSQEKFGMKFIPLPPLSEQERIVNSIESYFEQINYLDTNKIDLQISIKHTKSKILDLAIHGKLVEQDPNDEPTEELLKRIATSDNRPYKKFDDEEPFDIPKSWTWCKVNDLFNPMTSKKPVGNTFRYIDIDAIDNKKHCVIKPKSIAVKDAPSRASRELDCGDVLFSLVRPYLENIALIEKENSDSIASTVFFVCKPRSLIFPKFLFYIMTSKYVIKGLNQFMKGDNSPSISGDDIKNWLYPLPPLAEQNRIVSKIEELFKNLDEIMQNLTI